MLRDSRLYLEDILESYDKILTYLSGHDRASFGDNQMCVDAVVRNLEIIGEASKRVPSSVRDKMNPAPWREAAALRDILAHAYFGIDLDIVWDVVSNKLPGFCRVLEEYLARE